MSDWDPDDLATIEAKLLLPKWVQWLGERSELPDDLVKRVQVVVAMGYVPE